MTKAKPQTKRRQTFHFDPDQLAELERLAERSDKKAAWHVRQALELWIALHQPHDPTKEPGQISDVMAEMVKTFVEAQDSVHRVLRMAFHWYHDRQKNSIRGNQRRQDETLDRMERKIDQVIEIVGGNNDRHS